MALNKMLLKQPPRLSQREIYSNASEAIYGCWITVAEMIVKWKSGSTFFVRPKFAEFASNLEDNQGKAEYLNFQLDWYEAWGFKGQRKGGLMNWTTDDLAVALRDRGPLACCGNYGGAGGGGGGDGRPGLGGSAHDIVVFGVDGNKVRYIDPWDAGVKEMEVKRLSDRLWLDIGAVLARTTNYTNWMVSSTADPRVFEPDRGR